MDYVIKEYCVYTHRDMNGNVFYVGSGNRDRPFDVRKSARAKKWCDHVEKYGFGGIDIVDWFDDRKEAYDHEAEITELLMDMGVKLANTSIGTKHSDETKRKIGAAQKGRFGGNSNGFKGIWIGVRCRDSAVIAFCGAVDIITRGYNKGNISASSRGVYCGYRTTYKGCTWSQTTDKEYLNTLLDQDNFVDEESKSVLINFID